MDLVIHPVAMRVQVWGRTLLASCAPAILLFSSCQGYAPVGLRVSFAPSSVIRLGIASDGLKRGDRWQVKLERVRPEAPPEFQWDIRREAPPLLDPRADGRLILHLLDALESM